MEKEVVEDRKEIDNNNDANKFEEVETYQEVETIKKEIRTDSYFDGSLIELIGWKLLSFLITIISFGIAAPWGACMIYAYQINHTVYNGKRLKFEGTGGDLFVNIFKWVLLSIITLGIYTLFIPVRKTKWVISNIHFEDEHFIKNESFFDGKTIQLIGINILSTILNFISFGLLSAFTYCYKTKWVIKHTVINRKKIVFTGRAISLFGKSMLWGFLTVITFGIFGLWVPIKKLKWQNKNTHIKVVGEEEEKKDKSLYIAIPILIIGIILFSLIVPKIISNIDGTGDFNIEEMFENFGNALTGDAISTKRPSLESMNPNANSSTSVSNKDNTSTSTTNNKNTSTSNSKGNTSNSTGSSTSSSTSKNSQANFSKFSGTYIDVFGSSTTLTISQNGKVTISGRVVTNNLSSLKKQSNGSYSCSISGGEIIIYPVGVKSSQGNSNKVRIDVIENGGALCFQEK